MAPTFPLPSKSPVLHSRVFNRLKVRRYMSTERYTNTGGTELLKSSSLYREFQAEREEILRHKWLESEKAGYDIGFERALTDWILRHRSKWRRARQEERVSQSDGGR